MKKMKFNGGVLFSLVVYMASLGLTRLFLQEPKVFQYREADFTWHTQSWTDGHQSELSTFDKELRCRWDWAMSHGHFRYDVDDVVTRILPGSKKYVCKLNTKRNVIRRQPQAITSVRQPFNHATFNFTKVSKSEIIFDLRKFHHLVQKEHEENGISGRTKITRKEDAIELSKDRAGVCHCHAMVINVSPMVYGHSILVPHRDACKPQVLTKDSLALAIEMTLLSKHRGFTMGFNSLCANASVNHLHLHVLYLEHEINANHCHVTPLMGQIFEVTSLAIPGFVLQLHGSSINTMTTLAYSISSYLNQNEIAHNVILCRGAAFGEERKSKSSRITVRLYIWPREKYIFGSEDSVSFFVACFELAGYITTFDESSYNRLKESEADDIIAAKRLPSSSYDSIRRRVIEIANEI